MDERQEKGFRDLRKVLDVLSQPGAALITYFVLAILVNLITDNKDFIGKFQFIAFFALFAVYMIASLVRYKLLSKEEKEKEDEYMDWLNSQRGP